MNIKRIAIATLVGVAIVPLVGLAFAAMLTTITMDIGFIEAWWKAMVLLVTTNPLAPEGSNVRAWMLSIVIMGFMSFFAQKD